MPAESIMPTELFVFSGSDRSELIDQNERMRAFLESRPTLSACDLAATLALQSPKRYRVAIIASDLSDLQKKLEFVARKMLHPKCTQLRMQRGIFYEDSAKSTWGGKTALLFPGQGSQYHGMLADLQEIFPDIRAWFAGWDETFMRAGFARPSDQVFGAPQSASPETAFEESLYATDIGMQSGMIASLALFELLQQLEVRYDVIVGYSSGENAALIAADMLVLRGRQQLFDFMLRLKRETDKPEVAGHIPRGVCLAVNGVDRDVLNAQLERHPSALYLALDNCAHQVILFGTESAIRAVTPAFQAAGGICLRLPYDRAYHTPLFAHKVRHMRVFYDEFDFVSGRTPVYSCTTTQPFPDNPAAIRELTASQWASPVRFRETVENLYAVGVRNFIEIGPGSKLVGYTENTLRGREHRALACNVERRSGLKQIQEVAAQLFVAGQNINLGLLFRHCHPNRLDLCSVLEGDLTAKAVPARAVFPPAEPQVLYPRKQTNVSAESQASPHGARASASEVRLAILQGHFELMQKFLASQNSIHQLLAGSFCGGSFSPALPSAREQAAAEAQERTENWPLLGKILEQTADRLCCERSFHPAQDLYLRDHTLGRMASTQGWTRYALPVIPFAISMEVLAQAAACLIGNSYVVTTIENVRGYRWLAIDQDALILRVVATRQSQSGLNAHLVRVQLFEIAASSDVQPFIVFEGDVRCDPNFSASSAHIAEIPAGAALAQWSVDDFYRYCLFHGPCLRSVHTVDSISAQGIDAQVIVPPMEALLATGTPRFQTPALLLDCIGQLAAFWLVEHSYEYFGLFPYQISSFEQYAAPPASGAVFRCRGVIRIQEHLIEGDFTFFDTEGQIWAQITRAQFKYVPFPRKYLDTLYWSGPETFLSDRHQEHPVGWTCRRIDDIPREFLEASWGIWKRALAHMILNANERAFWYNLPERGPRRTQWLLGRAAAKDAVRHWAAKERGVELAPTDIEILPNRMGKPCVSILALEETLPLPEVSITHSGPIAAAALSVPGTRIGIDIQTFDPAKAISWQALAFSEEELQRIPVATPSVLMALWAAKEAASKAAETGLEGNPQNWKVMNVDADLRQVTIQHGAQHFQVAVWSAESEVMAVCFLPICRDADTALAKP
jgi:malonyl CoA-acyl carrier protein transacylase/phosphopantetheinyl transferase